MFLLKLYVAIRAPEYPVVQTPSDTHVKILPVLPMTRLHQSPHIQ